jgi:hypothetical protein
MSPQRLHQYYTKSLWCKKKGVTPFNVTPFTARCRRQDLNLHEVYPHQALNLADASWLRVELCCKTLNLNLLRRIQRWSTLLSNWLKLANAVTFLLHPATAMRMRRAARTPAHTPVSPPAVTRSMAPRFKQRFGPPDNASHPLGAKGSMNQGHRGR